ncbi:MAG: large subunit ribosomal protein [Acidobacteriota bacterium]|jgi:large subunit ribosomal protein L17|nr:large subunit ribosomal protein [Acidobacteriota bacterium]
MRHAVKGRKLGRTTAHRESLFRNQLASLILNERIVTTLPKAKELRPIAEKVVTHGKQGTIAARRWVLRWIPNTEKRRTMVKKVFDEIAPRFTERPGGYLRIVKLGPRLGDGAEMAVLEFVDREAGAAAPPPEEKKGKKAAPKATPKASPKDGSKEAKGGKAKAGGGAPKAKRGESS